MIECEIILKKLFIEKKKIGDIFQYTFKKFSEISGYNFIAAGKKKDDGTLIIKAIYNKGYFQYNDEYLFFRDLNEIRKKFNIDYQIYENIYKDYPQTVIIIPENKSTINSESFKKFVQIINILISEEERSKNEEHLSELKKMLDNSRDIFYILNDKAIIEYVNERVRDYGYTPDEIIGKRSYNFAHPDDVAMLRESVKKAFMTKKTSPKLVYRLLKKDGSYFYVEQRSEIYRKKDGKFIIVGNVRDITQEKNLIDELYKKNYILNQIFDNAKDIIYIKDLNENYVRVNKAFLKFFGLKKYEEALSKKDNELFDEETAIKIWEEDKIVMKGKMLSVIRERKTKTKNAIIHSIRVPLKDKYGKIEYILGIVRDITDIVKLQRHAAAIKIQEEINKALSYFAHDINNILSIITGYTSMAELETGKNIELLKQLRIINKSAQRIAHLIKKFRKKTQKISIK